VTVVSTAEEIAFVKRNGMSVCDECMSSQSMTSVVLNAARKSTNATFIYCARLACDARIPAKRIETCVAHTSRQSVVLVIIIFQKAKIRDLFFLESRLPYSILSCLFSSAIS